MNKKRKSNKTNQRRCHKKVVIRIRKRRKTSVWPIGKVINQENLEKEKMEKKVKENKEKKVKIIEVVRKNQEEEENVRRESLMTHLLKLISTLLFRICLKKKRDWKDQIMQKWGKKLMILRLKSKLLEKREKHISKNWIRIDRIWELLMILKLLRN